MTWSLPDRQRLRGLKSSFAVQLTSILLAMILLPLMGYYLVSYWTTERSILNAGSGHSLEILRNQRDYLTLQLDQIEDLAANLSQSEEICNVLARQNKRLSMTAYDELATKARMGYLLSNYRNLSGLVSIDVYSIHGSHFHVGDSLTETDEREDLLRELWDRTLKSPEPVVWHGVEDNVHRDSSSAKVLTATKLFMSSDPSQLKSEPIGMLIINYSTSYLYRHFESATVGKNAYLLVIDKSGRLIYHPDREKIGTAIAKPFGLLLKGTSGSFLQRMGNEDFLLSYEFVQGKDWYIVSVVPKKTLLANMQSIRRAGALMLVLSAIMIALYLRLFAQRVIEPISAIAEGFKNFQMNRLAPDWRMAKPRSLKQITDLVDWFNSFLENMEKRRESEVKLRIAATAFESQEGMFITDGLNRVLQVNTAFVAITGYQSEDAVGQDALRFVSGLEAPALAAAVAGAIHDHGSWRGEVLNARKNGERYPAWLNTTAVKNDSGETTHFVSTLTDITELKEAHSKLEEMNQRLEERTRQAEVANAAKSEFLANMSHEIRTPMNGVLGMAELLAGTSLNQEQSDYALAINRSGEALLSLLNDILDFSKIEAGQFTLESTPFNLEQVVFDVAELFRSKLAKRGVELLVDFDPTTPACVIGDPGRVRQVLNNLLSNAIKFTEKGHILVEVWSEPLPGAPGRTYQLAVRDTGIGIPKDKQAKLFRPFIQADSSTARRFGGSGLGLTLVSRILTAMGGTIRLESEEGVGTSLLAEFPLGEDVATGAAAPGGNLAGKRILVIDDLAINRKLVCRQIMAQGAVAMAAANGGEGLQVIERDLERGLAYDAAIVDLHMPGGMDGSEFSRRVRQDPRIAAMTMVLLTSTDVGPNTILEAGPHFDGYLFKPINGTTLVRALTTAMLRAKGQPGDAQVIRHSSTNQREPAKPAVQIKLEARILLVEDHEVNQLIARKILERAGVTVELAVNGRKALEQLAARTFDLVLMDCQMPEMDGFEATQRFRALEQGTGRHLPIIAMTAHSMAGDRDRCLQAGMDDYLTKPISRDALLHAVSGWLARSDPKAAD